MLIIPSIDLKDGQVVRLEQGDFARRTVYGTDPLATARSFAAAGARWIHVVDLDGARTGVGHHMPLITTMASELTIPIQLGGGIRTMEAVKAVLDAGVARVVLGTAAVSDRRFLEMVLLRYGDKIVVGIDARGGRIATQGWKETTDVDAIGFAERAVACGALRLIATEISRDGMRRGPDLDGLRALREAVDVPIIASGGVTTREDLVALRDLGVEAAIVGRAVYTGDIDLAQFPGCTLA
ncbi:MAG: 1-(5-phosphoribosyl)-5-[(5-phosphoribosylamino) methylideneamino]imidazole-4-carboxamide isomerase [Chloroflexota bacterium]